MQETGSHEVNRAHAIARHGHVSSHGWLLLVNGLTGSFLFSATTSRLPALPLGPLQALL